MEIRQEFYQYEDGNSYFPSADMVANGTFVPATQAEKRKGESWLIEMRGKRGETLNELLNKGWRKRERENERIREKKRTNQQMRENVNK